MIFLVESCKILILDRNFAAGATPKIWNVMGRTWETFSLFDSRPYRDRESRGFRHEGAVEPHPPSSRRVGKRGSLDLAGGARPVPLGLLRIVVWKGALDRRTQADSETVLRHRGQKECLFKAPGAKSGEQRPFFPEKPAVRLSHPRPPPWM